MSPDLDPLAALDSYELTIHRTVFADLCRWVVDKRSEGVCVGLDWAGPIHRFDQDNGAAWRTIVRNLTVFLEKKDWDVHRHGFFWRPVRAWRSPLEPSDQTTIPRHPLAAMFEILKFVELDRTDRFGTNDWLPKTENLEDSE
jgi:hypothetical protein